jgi:hypothetical protein
MEQELPSECPVISGNRVDRSLVFCVLLCTPLCVLLSVYFWPLYGQSFFDLRLHITPFVSSNCSCSFDNVYLVIVLWVVLRLMTSLTVLMM